MGDGLPGNGEALRRWTRWRIGGHAAREEYAMTSTDLAIVFAVMGLWIVLNRWVLPWFGIQTCMSGCCGGGSCRTEPKEPPDEPDSEGEAK